MDLTIRLFSPGTWVPPDMLFVRFADPFGHADENVQASQATELVRG